jgi:type III secretory pathway component EscR
MKNQDQLTARHKAIQRFILMIDLFDLQYPTFNKELSGIQKSMCDILTNHLNKFRNMFQKNADERVKEYLDNTSAIAWELLDELDKAQDKVELLTLARAYNAGEITINP